MRIIILLILLSFGFSETDTIEAIKSHNEAEVVKEDISMWKIGQYLDDFGDPTGVPYVTNSELFVGTFSNSAVTNEELLIKVLFHQKYIDFVLYEYGNRVVKDKANRIYRIGLKHNGKLISTSRFNKFPPCEARMVGDRIRVKGGGKFKKLLNAFKEGGELKFHIVQQISGYESEYRFALYDVSGLSEKLEELQNLKK